MKALTKHQQQLANNAVTILHALQDQGVEIMSIEGSGLTFWRPTENERREAYAIVSHPYHDQYNEFRQKSYEPSASNDLRIDAICP